MGNLVRWSCVPIDNHPILYFGEDILERGMRLSGDRKKSVDTFNTVFEVYSYGGMLLSLDVGDVIFAERRLKNEIEHPNILTCWIESREKEVLSFIGRMRDCISLKKSGVYDGYLSNGLDVLYKGRGKDGEEYIEHFSGTDHNNTSKQNRGVLSGAD